MTRRNVPEDSNLQQYLCENLCLCFPRSHCPSLSRSDALLSLLGHVRRSVWLKKAASVVKQQEIQCSQDCQLRRHGFIMCHLLSHFWRRCIQLPSSVLGCYLWREMLVKCTFSSCLNATLLFGIICLSLICMLKPYVLTLCILCLSRITFNL